MTKSRCTSHARLKFLRLLQLRVFGNGSDEIGNVRVGVFPAVLARDSASRGESQLNMGFASLEGLA
jgi:hypothetical protein